MLFVSVAALVGCMVAATRLWSLSSGLQVERVAARGVPVTIWSSTQAPGPAVVIAHGFAGSQQLMYSFAGTLARNGYVALTFDFPGHGQNTQPLRGGVLEFESRQAQLLTALDAVVALARERGDGRVALLGHSMGAEAVARYAQAHSDIDGTVAVSIYYDAIARDSPANLLLLAGDLELQLKPSNQLLIDQLAGGGGRSGVTYGGFDEGNARRLVYAPLVEHIGVLFSRTGMAESLAWFDQLWAITRPAPASLDDRAPWLCLLLASTSLLFWPLTEVLRIGDRANQQTNKPPNQANPLDQAAHNSVPISRSLKPATRPSKLLWFAAALLPAILTPVLLRFVSAADGLPILIGGPLALYCLIYGLLTAVGLVALRGRLGRRPLRAGLRAWNVAAIALLMVGYVFLTFGLPVQALVLNYFPPPQRWWLFVAVFIAMLPFFLADEQLARLPVAPRGAYAITKLCFVAGLLVAIALDLSLFVLALAMPLVVLCFAVYGCFSGLLYRRTGTTLPGALANAAIFAWIVAAVSPLVAQ